MQNNKTFRLFISSTFNDFRGERKALQEDVFPEIKKHCAEKGLTFQPIDLRWGVSNEAQLDQKALELCLNEVRNCKLHAAPNFLLMLGDRYGWVPLPYQIEQKEFETLIEFVSDEEKTKLNQWYKLDKNQLEFDSQGKLKSDASYVLQERTGDYEVYKNWEEAESVLREILQTAVENSSLEEDKITKYFQSATEAEIVEGVFPYLPLTDFQKQLKKEQPGLVEIDKTNVLGFFRSIDKESKIGDDFIASDEEHQKTLDFKKRVKETLENPLTKNILTLETQQTSKSTLDTAYLDKFKIELEAFLKARVDAQLNENQSISELKQEVQAHKDYAHQKTQNFIGQESILDEIKNYCIGAIQKPLVIYGPSGRGKSAIMAKAFQNQMNSIIRFVGATPNASAIKSILYSIFDELKVEPRTLIEIERDNQQAEDTSKTLDLSSQDNESFEDFSFRMHNQIMQLETFDKNITIFIDAVDQLSHTDQFLWLPETLPNNVKIIL